MSKKEIQRKRMLMYFIEAAQKIMETEGTDKITIRKVADIAGYNSATLYNYFDNLKHLITFASLKYLEEYNQKVVQAFAGGDDIYQIYIGMWDAFCETAALYPKAFLYIFFNDYKEELKEIVKEYYSIFPLKEEGEQVPEWLKDIKLEDRNKIYLLDFADSGRIDREQVEIINQITIALTHDFLLNISRMNEKDKVDEKIRIFITQIEYLIAGAVNRNEDIS